MCHSVVTGVCGGVLQCSDRSVWWCHNVVTGVCVGVSQCSDGSVWCCVTMW